jgi:integrase
MVSPFQHIEVPLMATEPTKPTLQIHHGGRSWTSYWRDDLNKLRTKRFGKESELGQRDALKLYTVWRDNEWKLHDHIRNPEGGAATLMCRHLARDYYAHAQTVYVKHGEPTSHIWQVKYAMEALASIEKPAAALESPELAALRDRMIHGERERGGVVEKYVRSVKTVNGRLQIIKEAFSWARERGQVPRPVLLDLMTVKPLRAGRCAAKAPTKITGIAWETAAETMKHTTRMIAAMIEIEFLGDMRPGEVCNLRPESLDVSGKVWIYTPWTHKMEHKDIDRKIAIGPRAQAILKPYLAACASTTEYIFSPGKSEAQRRQSLRQARKTPLWPSHVARYEKMAAARQGGKFSDHYTDESYRNAIHHACDKAGIPRWNPNQLRHTRATEIRRRFGLVAASDALGHTNLETSKIYAEQSLERAVEIARKIG